MRIDIKTKEKEYEMTLVMMKTIKGTYLMSCEMCQFNTQVATYERASHYVEQIGCPYNH